VNPNSLLRSELQPGLTNPAELDKQYKPPLITTTIVMPKLRRLRGNIDVRSGLFVRPLNSTLTLPIFASTAPIRAVAAWPERLALVEILERTMGFHGIAGNRSYAPLPWMVITKTPSWTTKHSFRRESWLQLRRWFRPR